MRTLTHGLAALVAVLALGAAVGAAASRLGSQGWDGTTTTGSASVGRATIAGSAPHANPPLPGTPILGAGWDVVTGESVAQRVFQLTEAEGKTAANPKRPGTIYSVADQVTVLPHPAVESTVSTFVAYTATEMGGEEASGASLGGRISWRNLSFSGSAGVHRASSFLQQRDKFSAYTRSVVHASLYLAALDPVAQLNCTRVFSESVAALPAIYGAANKAAYADFIQQWGTHTLMSAYFGGSGIMEVAVTAASAQAYTNSSVASQASVLFKFFQAGMSGTSAASWFTGSGSAQSQISMNFIGGDPTIAHNLTNWPQWSATYYDFPAFISSSSLGFRAMPLFTVVETLLGDTARANSLVNATMDYLLANPFPPDPPCAGIIECGSACCNMSASCCAGGCYDGAFDTCCSDSAGNAYACPSSENCAPAQDGCCDPTVGTVCHDSCYEGINDVCCTNSHDGVCGHDEECCNADGYDDDDSSGNNFWCCTSRCLHVGALHGCTLGENDEYGFVENPNDAAARAAADLGITVDEVWQRAASLAKPGLGKRPDSKQSPVPPARYA